MESYGDDRSHSLMVTPLSFPEGIGTDDDALIRAVVQRSEIDMENIREAYEEKYGRSLVAAIKVGHSGVNLRDDCDEAAGYDACGSDLSKNAVSFLIERDIRRVL